MKIELNKAIIDRLMADAALGNCTVILEVTSQGAVLTLRKDSIVAGSGSSLGRQTMLSRWIDKNNPDADHDITKAFHALP